MQRGAWYSLCLVPRGHVLRSPPVHRGRATVSSGRIQRRAGTREENYRNSTNQWGRVAAPQMHNQIFWPSRGPPQVAGAAHHTHALSAAPVEGSLLGPSQAPSRRRGQPPRRFRSTGAACGTPTRIQAVHQMLAACIRHRPLAKLVLHLDLDTPLTLIILHFSPGWHF